MSHRPTNPLLDFATYWLLEAINPALIMLMVGSLLHYLVMLLNTWGTVEGVGWVFSWFVFASVLIARISIIETTEHAIPFGIALAAAIWIVLARFGVNLAVAFILVAVSWWAIHRLTWDCTLLDTDPEGPGEGLLQTLGWDDQLAAAGEATVAPNGVDELPRDQGGPISETGPPDTSAKRTSSIRSHSRLWQWIVKTRHTHAPGLSVVLFAVAAIPLFGLTGRFLPNDGERTAALVLFCTYFASGLGLLATTSLLNLRRYLARRRVEIAPEMAAMWLAAGSAMILGLLAICAILPRPGAEYALARPPEWLSLSGIARRRPTSQFALGDRGQRDKSPDRIGDAIEEDGEGVRAPDDQASPPSPSRGDTSEHASATEATDDDGGPHSSDRNGAQSKRAENDTGDSSRGSNHSSSGDRRNGRQEEGSSPSRSEQSETTATDQPKQQRGPSNHESEGSGQRSERESDNGAAPESSHRNDASRPSRTTQRPSPRFPTLPSLGGLMGLVTGIIQLAMLVAILYFVWRARSTLFNALRDLWQSLIGGRSDQPIQQESVAKQPPRRRSLSEFPNPFHGGRLQLSPAETIRTTLEALEVWSESQRLGRTHDQTVDSFVRRIGQRHASLRPALATLVHLHAELAYGGTTIRASQVAPLRSIWTHLTRSTE